MQPSNVDTERFFARWMDQVDTCIEGYTGLTSADLADAAYHDMYDSGCSPDEAAVEVLYENGFDVD